MCLCCLHLHAREVAGGDFSQDIISTAYSCHPPQERFWTKLAVAGGMQSTIKRLMVDLTMNRDGLICSNKLLAAEE